ncbi:MAG: hypothetical protein VX265_06285, partial [Myxococcota bacterium]|nr:hypothetical protein [Myxococcota bacterium]
MRASILFSLPSLSRVLTAAGLLLATAGPAVAQSEDDFNPFDDEEEEEEEARPEEDEKPVDDFDPDDDDAWMDKKPDDAEPGDELEFDDEFDADDEEVKAQGEGEDTAAIYREYLEDAGRYGADEEALAWERYLKKYPNSLFRARVEARLEELSEQMYTDYL